MIHLLENPVQITLSDYDYRKEIQHRIWLSEQSDTTIELLKEIVYGPIKTSKKALTEALSLSVKEVTKSLEPILAYQICKISGEVITVDKHLRRYFERRVEIFEENFTPGISFIKDLLAAAPITSLPVWYALPRMTENIVTSLIEVYLQSPKRFENYLKDQPLTNPIQKAIWKELLSSNHFSVPTKKLIKKLNISKEQMHEAMLYLEFRFMACIYYEKNNGVWEEHISLFSEWKEYQKHITHPAKNSKSQKSFFPKNTDPLDHLTDMNEAMNALEHGRKLKCKALQTARKLALVESYRCTEKGKQWLQMAIVDQAAAIYRQASLLNEDIELSGRQMHSLERTLRNIAHTGWVCLQEFLDYFSEPMEKNAESYLTCLTNGQWKYKLPQLSPSMRKTVSTFITQQMVIAGMVETTESEGVAHFRLTSFGKMIIS